MSGGSGSGGAVVGGYRIESEAGNERSRWFLSRRVFVVNSGCRLG